MSLLSSILHTMLLSFIELLYLVGTFITVGLVIGVLERYSNAYFVKAFGPKGVLLTAWIGVPIHEIGHLIQCFIWGHRVIRVKLLQFHHGDGVLGFVQHQYNPNNIYQQIGNFFIGLGPIFSGIGSLMFGMYLLIPESYESFIAYTHQHVTFEKLGIGVLKTTGRAVLELSKSLFTLHNLINPLFWIFLLIAICISSHTSLSKKDIQGSAKGLLTLFGLLVFINIAGGILGFNSYQIIVRMAEYNAYVLAFSAIAVLFSLITLVLSYILSSINIRN
jgi:tryptophan-rich sensory protein